MTGVQTCALPISRVREPAPRRDPALPRAGSRLGGHPRLGRRRRAVVDVLRVRPRPRLRGGGPAPGLRAVLHAAAGGDGARARARGPDRGRPRRAHPGAQPSGRRSRAEREAAAEERVRGERGGPGVSKGTVFLVDDEPGLRSGIRSFLETHGYRVQDAASCRDAEAGFRAALPDAAILDLRLPDGDGVNLVARLKSISADVPLIVLTGHGSIETAVSAIQEGAEQFLTKPVDLPAILRLLERLLQRPPEDRGRLLERGRLVVEGLDPFPGDSAAIRRLADEARRLRRFDA